MIVNGEFILETSRVDNFVCDKGRRVAGRQEHPITAPSFADVAKQPSNTAKFKYCPSVSKTLAVYSSAAGTLATAQTFFVYIGGLTIKRQLLLAQV